MDLMLFSGNWPRQGLLLNGHAFRRQMWAPAIGVIVGGVLPTPTTHDTRRRGVNSKQRGLSNTEDWLTQLPTPKASDGERGRDKARARSDTKGRELATVVRDQMLPTPRTCSAMAARLDTAGNLEGERFPNLETVVAREMLPTPTAALSESGGSNCTGVRQPENLASALKTTLEVPQVYQGQARKRMLLTPTANDWKGRTNWEAAERHGPQRLPDLIPTGAATYLNPSFVEEMMGFPVGWTVCEP
jgi:hypothetical protein